MQMPMGLSMENFVRFMTSPDFFFNGYGYAVAEAGQVRRGNLLAVGQAFEDFYVVVVAEARFNRADGDGVVRVNDVELADAVLFD
jgi:hypothetical protein